MLDCEGNLLKHGREGTTVNLDISIEIGAGVHDAPKLMLPGEISIYGRTTPLTVNTRSACSLLEPQPCACRNTLRIDAFHYDGPRHPVQILTIALHMLVV